jgi:signal transduction histidine kinase
MRPLDPLSSIKTKLGVLIVSAVGVTVVAIVIGVRIGSPKWLTGGLAAILALGMVQFLARGMTSPLREMAAAARDMARGDYTRRVSASSRDEVGELGRAFNKMAADLAEVDRMRKDLVANVSHELRTPISALQAVLENMIDGVEPPDPATLQTMLTQVERLGRLVSQLLDLSRLESGAIPIDVRPFEVGSLLEQAAAEFKLGSQRASDKKVRLDLILPEAGLTATGDAERVHQVVANLLDNAVRHSPEGGVVGLTATEDDGGVRIEVRDEGPGIPEGERERIFERFYRSDSARAGGSSGLGLAIARWIVDMHGGEIKAENADPSGCRVVVRLPR